MRGVLIVARSISAGALALLLVIYGFILQSKHVAGGAIDIAPQPEVGPLIGVGVLLGLLNILSWVHEPAADREAFDGRRTSRPTMRVSSPAKAPGFYEVLDNLEARKSIRDGTWKVTYKSNGQQMGWLHPGPKGTFDVYMGHELIDNVKSVRLALESLYDADA